MHNRAYYRIQLRSGHPCEAFCELLFTVALNCCETCCWQRIKQRYSVHAKHQIKNIPVITCPVACTITSFGYFCEFFCIIDFEKCSINGDYWDSITLELGTSPCLCLTACHAQNLVNGVTHRTPHRKHFETKLLRL